MPKELPANFQPKDESIKIWRYIDFTKFLSLLVTESLYFTRANNFEDAFEGSSPKAYFKDIPETPFTKVMSEIRESLKYDVTINCWHSSEHESVAMWKIYGDKGIAIQSTLERLKNSIIEDKNVLFGAVQYVNYEQENFENNDCYLVPFFCKRHYFNYEQEIRAIVIDRIDNGDVSDEINPYENLTPGLLIKVNVGKLVETIYVSPDIPDYIFELICDVSKKYGFNFNIKHSNLKNEPLF